MQYFVSHSRASVVINYKDSDEDDPDFANAINRILNASHEVGGGEQELDSASIYSKVSNSDLNNIVSVLAQFSVFYFITTYEVFIIYLYISVSVCITCDAAV